MKKDVTLLYLYQPCLLSLSLFSCAFFEPKTEKPAAKSLWYLGILAVSELELTFSNVKLYPAALLLSLLLGIGRARRIAWSEVLTASVLSGLICWKVSDVCPLFPSLTLLCALMLMIPILLICREREDRFLGCAIGGLFYELFFCLREYLLFSFCVIRLGSRDGLSITAAAHLMYIMLDELLCLVQPNKLARFPYEFEGIEKKFLHFSL